VERFGLGINYEQISPMLEQSLNRRIWVSTARAVENIRKGMMPPAIGAKVPKSVGWSG